MEPGLSTESQHERGDQSKQRKFPETRVRSSHHLPESEKNHFFTLISRSGWLLLITKLLLSVVAKKIELESSTEKHVANLGLLLKDAIRNFYINYSLNLAIGVPLGLLADCVLRKKVIMVLVLCLSISFYFCMIAADLRVIWDQRELFHRKTQTFIQASLHSIRGIETAAMLESIGSDNYKLLYGYTFLKVFFENLGGTFYIVVYFLSVTREDSELMVHFLCLFLCMAIFFIWMLYVSSLKHSAVSGVSLITVRNSVTALIWKLRLINRNEDFVDPVHLSTLKPVMKQKYIKPPKRIKYLFLLIIPSITTGFLFLASVNILREPFSRLKTWKTQYLNVLETTRRSLILATLPLVEFFLVPTLRRILQTKITFTVRLVTSMIIGICAYLYGVVVVRLLISRGSPLPDHWTSEVRFVNALNYSVVVRPIDSTFTSGSVPEKSELLLTYVRTDSSQANKRLFEVQLESTFQYVTMVSLEGEKCITYLISDFMELHRVPGADPIFEGPPGTNYPSRARLYFANLDPELTVNMVLTFQHSNFHYLPTGEDEAVYVKGGRKKVFQVHAGTYILTIAQADISRSYSFGPGGVYGVIYSPEIKEGTLNHMIFEILPPTSYSPYYGFIFELLAWTSVSFIIVIMEVFVFIKCPENWRCSAFSYYHFFNSGFFPMCHYLFDLSVNESGLVGWWAILLYATVYVVCCVMTGFILIKFKNYFAL